MELNLLNLVLVLLVAWTFGLLANRLGQPAVLGELLGGIVLGPPLLGILQAGPTIDVLAQAGILLMMLYIGMEVHPGELRKATRTGLLAAAGGFITPFVLCYGLALGFGYSVLPALFIGVAASVTAIVTKSRILVDLRLLDTRVAHVMLAAALITDLVSLIVFSALFAFAETAALDAGRIIVLLLKALAFLVTIYVLGVHIGPIVGRRVQNIRSYGRTAGFTFVLVVGFGFAQLAEFAEMHGIIGAFLAGLFLRERALGATVSREVMQLVRDAAIGFLAPIFFVAAGFEVTLDVLRDGLPFLLSIIVLATVGKIAGTTVLYLFSGHGWREGVTVGVGMNGRGAVEIIIAQIGLSLGLISQDVFSTLVLMAIVTTAIVPATLKRCIAWLRSRGELDLATEQRNGVVIVGAGPTARELGRTLVRSQPVWVIDRNREQCAFAASDGLTAINGSALSEEVLSEAHAGHARYLFALTPNAEVNALVAHRARTAFHIPHVCVINAGDEAGHAALVDHLQTETAFGGPTSLPEWDYRIERERFERMGLSIERPLSAQDLFERLQRHRKSLPLAIRRRDQYEPFHSGTRLESGDRVVLLQFSDVRVDSFDRFDRLVADCPVLDLEHGMSMGEFLRMSAAWLAPRLDVPEVDLAARLTSRESTSSTVLLPGLAIPHTVIEGEEKFDMLITRCRNGIKVPGHADRVHALFVLAGTADERTFHLRAISAIAQLVQQADFEKEWLLAADAEALRKLMLHGPRRRIADLT